jgi:hypothetical protein
MLVDYKTPIPGAALVAAGITGVLRYWSKGGAPSIVTGISAAEIADLEAHGIEISTIYEAYSADWMGGGWNAGVQAGAWLKNQFGSLGFTPRTVWFAADATTLSGSAVTECLDGAASIIGRGIIGLYGFLPQLQAAYNGGHAVRYWLCGHYANPADYPWICLYQCNGSQPSGPTMITIAGQTCDVDIPLSPDWGQEGGGMDLNTVYTDWAGNQQTVQGTFDHITQDTGRLTAKVPSKVNSGYTLPPLEFLPWIDKNVVDVQAAVAAMSAKLDALTGQLAAEEADLLAAIRTISAGAVDPAAVAAALEPALPAPLAQALLAALAAKLGGAA